MAYICVRCKNNRKDFEFKNNKRLKTCNRCRQEKQRYAKTKKGKQVYSISSKKWNQTIKGKISAKQTYYRMIKKYPLKVKARNFLYRNVKKGKLKKESCQKCMNKKVEAHHEDYNKPLEVIWLCKKHHVELHELRKEK
jgi:hypothetical protein